MTARVCTSDQAFVCRRLQDIGVSRLQDRTHLLGRLQQQAEPGEPLHQTLDRRLRELLAALPLQLDPQRQHRRDIASVAAEAAVILSGIAGFWPLSLFDDAAELPAEALERLKLALPVAAPPTVATPMPVQSLEPVALSDLLG